MLTKALQYLRFVFKGVTKYNIHSPFVHSFIQNIIDDKQQYYNYLPIEQLREVLLNQKQKLELKDFGAGSNFHQSKEVSLSKLAKYVQSSKHKGQLLFRISNYFQPDKILELGTSLGLSTAYLAVANKKTKVVTVEADSNVASIAKNNFARLKLSNVKVIVNQFENVLEDLSKDFFELVFFDGNHTKAATLKYFNWAKKNTSDTSIFIFDDIYWSKEMNEAWNIICDDSKVSLSIDLFSIGIVFFIPKNQKEHFKLIHQVNFF